jgi:acetate kinase
MPNTSPPTFVLALNAGSSSLKASVIADGADTLVSFLAERLTTADSSIHVCSYGKPSEDLRKEPGTSLSHAEALAMIIEYLEIRGMLANLLAVGHRVVHGGTIFPDSAIIGQKEMEEMASISHLAPL